MRETKNNRKLWAVSSTWYFVYSTENVYDRRGELTPALAPRVRTGTEDVVEVFRSGK